MKKDIHPTYYPAAKIICACGNSFTAGSTIPEIHVEICSVCHPFFSGKQKVLDNRGRIERYQRLVSKKTATKKRAIRPSK